MLTWTLLLLSGYFLFLAGFSLFMHFESRKIEENQYRIKLLPPPADWRPGLAASETAAAREVAARRG